jgi:hypothetical protein
MKYLKKFNENFSAINENVELPQSVKDTLQDVFSKMSPQDIEALRKQLAGVTEEEIKDAAEEEVQAQVQGGQGQAQSAPTNENFLKKAGNWISRNRGTIGATLLVGGLATLGLKGEQAEHITNILRDNQTLDVLTDPVWLAASISSLLGLVGIGSAVSSGFKKAGEDAKIAWENNMIKRGLAKRDENGVLVSLKTGKPLVYAR